MEKAKVYFCKEITPENVIKMYEALGKKLPGNVAVKVHSGEEENRVIHEVILSHLPDS